MKFTAVLISILLISFGASSYEVDQFTNRNFPLKDSTKEIDAEIQSRLDEAVKQTNGSNAGLLGIGATPCDGTPQDQDKARFTLFQNLRDLLTSRTPIGEIEKFATESKTISKRKIPIDESIYAEAKEKSFVLKKFGIDPVIKVNGVQIGTDKLGHFIDQGYDLYLDNFHRKDSKGRREGVLRSSKSSEMNGFGISTTGVYSYADTAANYHGSEFWNNLCGNPKGELTDEERKYFEKYRCLPNAYLKCENKKWLFNPKRKFTLADYVNPSWDEGINCSSYDEEISGLVFKRMQMTNTRKGGINQPCPVEPEKCAEIAKLYASGIKKKIINPICRNVENKIKKNEPIDPNIRFDYTFRDFKKKTDDSNSTSTNNKVNRGQ
jgi:hypothetical protein